MADEQIAIDPDCGPQRGDSEPGQRKDLRRVASGIPGAEGLAVSGDGVLFISGESTVYSVSEGDVAVPFAHGFNDPAGLAIDASGDL